MEQSHTVFTGHCTKGKTKKDCLYIKTKKKWKINIERNKRTIMIRNNTEKNRIKQNRLKLTV
jgi:hypothetical protein